MDMATSEDQLETIVQAVLQRIGRTASASQQGELALNDKVISEATLANRLDGVRRLSVTARAVVTPSARDILKEKNVALVRSLPVTASAAGHLIVAACGKRIESIIDITNLIASLRQRGIDVEQLKNDDIGKITSDLAEKFSHSEIRGVLLTDQTAVAVCVTNRNPAVRAAAVESRGEVNEVVQNLGTNLLIINPLRHGQTHVQRIVEAFAAMPAQACPTDLKPWLE